jgi:hypothetical protein
MRASIEIAWILTGQSPDSVSMARLAEYMQHLATLLGEADEVRFARVDAGSLKLVAAVPPGRPAGRIRGRVAAIRDRRAPAADMAAYRKLDAMVAEDGGKARLQINANNVLRFPGRAVPALATLTLDETVTITGRLYALSEEPGGALKMRIRPRDGQGYILCTADPDLGPSLAGLFQQTVRAQGWGRWTRNPDGIWICENAHITRVDHVNDVSLRATIDALRAIPATWPSDPLGDWDRFERDGAA